MLNYAGDWIFPKAEDFKTERDLSTRVLSVLDKWFHVQEQVSGLCRGRDPVRIDAILVPRDPDPWYDEEPAFGVEFKRPVQDANLGSYYAWAGQAADYAHSEFGRFGRVQVFLCPSPMVGYLSSEEELSVLRQRRANGPTFAEESAMRLAALLPDPRDTPERIAARADKAKRDHQARLDVEDTTARNLGFEDNVHREHEQRRATALELMRLLGHFNVGELMPSRYYGWTLLRSGVPLWSENRGIHRRFSVKPRTATRGR
ncbi:hypothetical protein AB0O20_33580 [Streptomyces kronopolitis]|uniref:hypothetical protein n=1 Tax=Streptomyces kronopolitis TaxID=1612435 RepID=UPI00341805FE